MQNQEKQILIVDDDPDILAFVQAMLEDEGYSVAITDTYEDLRKFDGGKLPDLILLDMLLSGKDGREIARQLKSQERTKHIPVIMLSAHPIAEREAHLSGANDFLAKPFEMDDLLTIVAKYLSLVEREAESR